MKKQVTSVYTATCVSVLYSQKRNDTQRSCPLDEDFEAPKCWYTLFPLLHCQLFPAADINAAPWFCCSDFHTYNTLMG